MSEPKAEQEPPSSAPEPPLVLARGALVGRYIVLAVLGQGETGDVYAAYDPELNRKVAVKVLRSPAPLTAKGSRAEGRDRRLRDAQALARLSHPNVVGIFDVGTFGDTVFLAMEFIDGNSVGQWRQEGARTWREVLRVFLAAGRGLAAAHAAGLVHKDFKPESAIVGRDGKVRVMDFAVAPAAQASVDQFSYCVALYESLYGDHPGTVPSTVPATVPSTVPSWIRKILLRGLSPTPADRYPSMEQLLAALEKDPGAARRRWALYAGVAMLTILGAFALGVTATHRLRARELTCQGGGAKLAGIWEPGGLDSPRKQAIRAAFAATGMSYALRAFDSASQALDQYVNSWMTIYGEACEATAVRHQQSADVLDLRMSCLTSRVEDLRALTDLFLRADGPLVEKATGAAQALTPLERCSDLAILRAVVKPPDDPAVRSRVEQVRRRLGEAKALQDAGHMSEALARAQSLIGEARELGYSPLKGQVLTRVGWLSFGRPVEAEAILAEAAFSASAGGDDELVAEAAIAQVMVVGYLEGQPERARHWINLADATLNRIGGHDILRAWLVNNQATVVYAQGRYEDALALFRQSTALKEKVLGPNAPDVATSLGNMGDPLARLGRFDEALATNQRTLQILEASGDDQEGLPIYLSSRGEYLNALGRFAEAEGFAARATKLWEQRLEAENSYLAYSLTVLGRSYLGQARPRDAVAPLARAYDLRSRLDPEPSRLGETAFALAQALWHNPRDRSRALALAAEAERAYARTPETRPLSDVRVWLRRHAPA